jgi:hypothetical protein
MTAQETLMVIDATEKLCADNHTAIDAFLDQTRHVCRHGGNLTELRSYTRGAAANEAPASA